MSESASHASEGVSHEAAPETVLGLQTRTPHSGGKPFNPPSPERLEDHLSRWAPQPVSPWVGRAPWLALGVLVVMSLMLEVAVAAILPWVALLGLMGWGMYRVRTAQSLERRVNALGEQAMLRRYPRAVRDAWLLLPQVQRYPSLHGRTVATAAHCLDDLGCYEQAIVAYDHLLSGMPSQGLATVHIRLNRAIAAMRCDRLVDADEEMRRVRGVVEEYRDTPITAVYRMAQLVQDTRTHHFTDALDFEPALLNDLRSLGVEAGYGYAMMALCCFHARPEDPIHGQEQRDKARLWWDRATLMLSPDTLVRWLPELAVLREEMRM